MEDPYTELTRAIIKLKEEIVELQDAIYNLYALAETMLWIVIGARNVMRVQEGVPALGGNYDMSGM